MSIFSAPYQATVSTASVLIGAEVHGLLSRPRVTDRAPLRIELRYAVSGAGAPILATTVRVLLNDEATRRRAFDEGVHVLTRFVVPPRRYRVHVTAHNSSNGRSVLVTHDLEVPDLTVFPIAVSGIT